MIEYLFKAWIVRVIIGSLLFARGSLFLLVGQTYRASADYCWVYRVSDVKLLKRVAFPIIKWMIKDKTGQNLIRNSFLESKEALRIREQYSLSGKGSLDIMRDLIILKDKYIDEKGVLLIKYSPTFDAFLAFFNIEKVLKDYYIVLEPSWVGACDPSILMFVYSSEPVIVQTPEKDDYKFIDSLQLNLHPINLGSGDWVDGDLFSSDPSLPKKYDLIMVANWGRHKRHKVLFKALSRLKSRAIKVILIGFNWAGRSKENIKDEMNGYDLRNAEIVILENLHAKEVSKYLNQSKVFVLLTKKEGPNKAIVESFFANVPAILYENFIGGAKDKINPQTGILSSDEELSMKIEYMLDHYQKFSPRGWALQNTGSLNASLKLNSFVREIAIKNREKWTANLIEKVNVPNLEYKDRQRERSALITHKVIKNYLRSSV